MRSTVSRSPKRTFTAPEQGIGNVAPGAVKREREVIDQALVGVHPARTPAGAEIGDDGLVHARRHGQRRVKLPFELAAPFPRGDEDDELRETARQLGMEAQIIAHRLEAVGQFGAAQQVGNGPLRFLRLPMILSAIAFCSALIWLGARAGNRSCATAGAASHRVIPVATTPSYAAPRSIAVDSFDQAPLIKLQRTVHLGARSKLWVAISAASPSARTIASRASNTPPAVRGSRLPVGSSASRIFGRLASARAMATRCCSPPDNCAGRWVSRAPQAQPGEQPRRFHARALARFSRDHLRQHHILQRVEFGQQVVAW